MEKTFESSKIIQKAFSRTVLNKKKSNIILVSFEQAGTCISYEDLSVYKE